MSQLHSDEFLVQLTSNEGLTTETWVQQINTEKSCVACYNMCERVHGPSWRTEAPLLRKEHVTYLLRGLQQLSQGFSSLDASRPWLVYWILHALELLDALPGDVVLDRVAAFLSRCQNPTGGFGGGPGQISHLAPTYAAVHALMICGTKFAYEVINRQTLYNFLLSMRSAEGSFTMHKDGEVDVRGAYCALSCASILNMMTPELTTNVAQWIAKCQTYEGGIGGEPFAEAHGGYAFCGLAALVILEKTHVIDMNAFLKWAARKQMRVEGGFQGRANKLVDGCYSYWQGGVFPLLDRVLINPKKYDTNGNCSASGSGSYENYFGDQVEGGWCFHQEALQEYLLTCCQSPTGGLLDKPLKRPDYYHSCYTLSGMSIAQNNPKYMTINNNSNNSSESSNTNTGIKVVTMVGDRNNLLKEMNAVHNICEDKYTKAKLHFAQLQFTPTTTTNSTSVSTNTVTTTTTTTNTSNAHTTTSGDSTKS